MWLDFGTYGSLFNPKQLPLRLWYCLVMWRFEITKSPSFIVLVFWRDHCVCNCKHIMNIHFWHCFMIGVVFLSRVYDFDSSLIFEDDFISSLSIVNIVFIIYLRERFCFIILYFEWIYFVIIHCQWFCFIISLLKRFCFIILYLEWLYFVIMCC